MQFARCEIDPEESPVGGVPHRTLAVVGADVHDEMCNAGAHFGSVLASAKTMAATNRRAMAR